MATVSSQPADQPDRERARIEADPEWARIEEDPEYRELRAMQRRFMGPATAGYLLAYFGFLLLAGLAPGFLGTDVLGSINLGFILMAGLFVLVWALVRAYVKVARDRWDPQAAKVIAGLPEAAVAEPVSPASGGAGEPLAGRPDDAGGGRAGRGEAGRKEVSR
jgi:uncharacterized membrane protein (DUF485 family)